MPSYALSQLNWSLYSLLAVQLVIVASSRLHCGGDEGGCCEGIGGGGGDGGDSGGGDEGGGDGGDGGDGGGGSSGRYYSSTGTRLIKASIDGGK